MMREYILKGLDGLFEYIIIKMAYFKKAAYAFAYI